jgi:glycosyltransferase involved in cell wall biosynthesis
LSSAASTGDGSLRILFLDSWLKDRSVGSGSAVAIAGLAEGLQSLGHDVTTLRPEKSYANFDLTRISYNLGLPGRLRGQNADLVVGFDFDGGLLPPRFLPSRYVVSLKGVLADEARFETGRDRARLHGLSRIEARNARSAGAVICTSRYSADQATHSYDLSARRVHVVPEGIRVPEWSDVARTAAGRRAARHSGPVILSVARQYRRKNTADLLRAFRLLRTEYPQATLRVVGEGPELPALRDLAGELEILDHTRFVGSLVGLEALKDEYAGADIFCLPSLQEGFGIVFLEAMASGLPIVAARAGAVPEVAPDGEVSLLVEPGDVEALASALCRLAGARKLRERLGASGAGRWKAYDWPIVADQFLAAARIAHRPPRSS